MNIYLWCGYAAFLTIIYVLNEGDGIDEMKLNMQRINR